MTVTGMNTVPCTSAPTNFRSSISALATDSRCSRSEKKRVCRSPRTSSRMPSLSRRIATPGRCSAPRSQALGCTRNSSTSTGLRRSFYEPAGSVHTLKCIEDDTRVWFQMYGVNLTLEEEDNVSSVSDGAGALALYQRLCEAIGLPRPNVLVG
jgi:hypothetical protein